jgi:phosphoglycerol transferase MdoB-like AlkP superfamily enzyme
MAPPLIALGIRGGLMPIPIHQSDVFYSKNNFLNLTSVNSQWNLIASISKNFKYKDKNPFIYYSLTEAKNRVDSLYSVEKDTTVKILTVTKPNVVLILLESWSADLVHSCGGYDSITPNFEKLVADGVLFTKSYASGTLSDQGMAAVLCGYPTLPNVIIVNQPDKYVKIPCFPRDMQKIGYHTSFMFGGQLSYGNIKGLIYYNQFDDIFEGKDFPSSMPKGRLGVHDEYMFDFWLKRISTYPQPFFATAFTLSSHSPYDQPFPEVFPWGGDGREYINSAYYTDSCLGDFFAKAKKQAWYNNTLFILVADHSHNSPKAWNFYSKNYRQIPMLFYGNVLKSEFRGMKMDSVCSQTDLAATLLSQLGMPYEKYNWSKNLFNPYSKHFAFFGSDAASGWIDSENDFIFEYDKDNYFEANFRDLKDSLKSVKCGKSYLETLFQEYLDL